MAKYQMADGSPVVILHKNKKHYRVVGLQRDQYGKVTWIEGEREDSQGISRLLSMTPDELADRSELDVWLSTQL